MMVAPDKVMDPAATEEMRGGVVSGAALLTVTLTAAEVVRLPAPSRATAVRVWLPLVAVVVFQETAYGTADRKSTRLNSSHSQISYAVFCLKKKKKDIIITKESLARHEGPKYLHKLDQNETLQNDKITLRFALSPKTREI